MKEMNYFYKNETENSPPLEGCPEGGVENNDIIAFINNIPIRKNFVLNLPYNPNFKKLVRAKRKAGILSEVLFWQQVHKKKFHTIDFDRQRNIGNYIVDFYVKRLGLIVEIYNEDIENTQEDSNSRRLYFELLGLKMFRCLDADVRRNIVNVMADLERFIIQEFGIS
jgi:very-short-patch-repair endonuclease